LNNFGGSGIYSCMSKDADSLPDLDVAALRQLCLQQQAVIAQQSATVQQQVQKITQLEHRLAKLLQRTFGKQSEKLDPDQLLLFDQEELAALSAELAAEVAEREAAANESSASAAENAEQNTPAKRKGHGRRELPAHLPREQKRYELTPEERVCPCCGLQRAEIGSETSEQLEFIPASFKVIEHIRVKYACSHCEENVALAPKPPQPVEKGLPGPGLLAQTVLAKYGDHAPLYRQEDIAARQGLILRRSTLCDWIAAAADLASPLYERMKELALQSRVLHTDDTTVKLLDPLFDQARTARFWTYIGDAAHPYTVYDFTDSRKRDGPEQFLSGYRGYLQADAYGGYDGLFLNSGAAIIEVACWAHARRYWFDAIKTDPARAHQALGFIARLYEIERNCANGTPQQRHAARQTHALPILAQFKTWLAEQAPRVLPKSPIGEAFTYTLNQWAALLRYTEDGALAIDNNVAERTLKLCAIGRRNWLFVASQTGGRRAAILFSLIASARANQVEPWAWLRDVFTRLPLLAVATTSDLAIDPAVLDELLPDRWLQTHPTHRWQINDLRQKERERSQQLRQKKRRR
jgi:transposase